MVMTMKDQGGSAWLELHLRSHMLYAEGHNFLLIQFLIQ